MPQKHAYLSFSGAKLDLHCPGNRREQKKQPRSSSDASAKGTGMHALAEACLKRGHNTTQYIGWWCGDSDKGGDFLLKAKPSGADSGLRAFKIEADGAQNVQLYVDHVRKCVADLPGAELLIEEPVQLSENSWGTPDAQIRQPFGVLRVPDYKNGFTYVEESSPQVKLYLLASMGLDNPYGFTKLIGDIVQPNAGAGESIRSIMYPPEELVAWYKSVYAPAARACMEPNAPCIPGPWCKDGWCNARRSCGALAAYNNDTAQGMFTAVEPAAVSLPDAKDMPPEMRAKVLERFGLIKSWYTEIYDHEYSLAMRGNNTWGKLVKGRGSRGWADESVATAQLNTLLHGEIYDKKLKTPAKAEAALKAQGMKAKNAKAAVADLVETKPGSPTLVSLDAPGTSVAVVDGMFGAIA